MPTPSVNPRDHLVQYGVVKKLLVVIFSIGFLFALSAKIVFAADYQDLSCSKAYKSAITVTKDVDYIYAGHDHAPVTITISGLQPNLNYKIRCRRFNKSQTENLNPGLNSGDNGTIVWQINDNKCWQETGEMEITLQVDNTDECLAKKFPVHDYKNSLTCSNHEILSYENKDYCFVVEKEIKWKIKFENLEGPFDGKVYADISNVGGLKTNKDTRRNREYTPDAEGYIHGTDTILKLDDDVEFDFYVVVKEKNFLGGTTEEWQKINCSPKKINKNDIKTVCSDTPPIKPSDPSEYEYDICKQLKENSPQWSRCRECYFTNDGIWTAIGCIQRNSTSILQTFITLGLNIGGGVATIMLLIGGFTFSISQGDPKKTGEAKEMITSALIGLLFIIFSVTILQFIGVTVLHIPGFGGT